ncbi:hypothetical protein [Nocardia sp. IFM 10818]
MIRHRRSQPRGHRRLHRAGGGLALRHGDDLKKRPAGIPTTRCFVGKRRYFARRDAEFVLAVIDRGNTVRREQRSYRCPVCHGWHLTSWSLEKFEARVTVAKGATGTAGARERLDAGSTVAGSAAVREPFDLSWIVPDPSVVPTPLAVALRTAPIRRAEAARARAEALSVSNSRQRSTIRITLRARVHGALHRMIRRLRRI